MRFSLKLNNFKLSKLLALFNNKTICNYFVIKSILNIINIVINVQGASRNVDSRNIDKLK